MQPINDVHSKMFIRSGMISTIPQLSRSVAARKRAEILEIVTQLRASVNKKPKIRAPRLKSMTPILFFREKLRVDGMTLPLPEARVLWNKPSSFDKGQVITELQAAKMSIPIRISNSDSLETFWAIPRRATFVAIRFLLKISVRRTATREKSFHNHRLLPGSLLLRQ